MEVVALHEQLRRAFAPVLKVLRSPPLAAVATPSPTAAAANATKKPVKHSPKAHAEPRENGSAAPLPPSSSTMMDIDTSAVDAPLPSAPAIAIAIAPPAGQSLPLLPEPALTAPQEPSTAPQQLVRIDRFKQHCLTVVHRLNTYQYGSKQVFCQELAQLALVVNSPAQQQALGALAERVAALDVPDALDGSMSRGRQVLGSLEFDASAAIPGLQEVTGDASGAANAKKWLVNVNVKDQSIPVGSFLTRENALQAYELFRFDLNTSRGGAATVYKLAEQLALDQRASDAQVLDAATNACHTHMSWQRLHDMISLSTGPERETTPTAPAVTTPVKPAQPLSQRASGSSKTTPSSPRSPVASSPPSSPTAGTTPSKSKNPKRKKTAHRLAHLRLRRLMQIRLCPHLQGQPVCVIRRTGDEVEGVDWTPTGRLEAGKVFSFKHGKLVTFADFVSDELRHPISACPHIYVVKTRESIDSHLVHCDAFSEDDRLLLGKDFGAAIKKYTKAGEAKGSSSSSRRR